MTFEDIQDEVISLRFKESQRESVKRWINMRYHFLWGVADWPWKRMGPVDLALLGGDANPALPDDFDRPLAIYDDAGMQLDWMPPDDFDHDYLYIQINGGTSKPESFKWVNDVITLAPTPDQNYTYKLIYERGMAYLANGTTPTSGQLTSAGDEPIWAEPYHYVLVFGAVASGLRAENDPTFDQMEEEYATFLQSMKDHYLPTMSPVGNLQYGRDPY